jgi:3-oxoacyl-[acyl-carrier protein] reductase
MTHRRLYVGNLPIAFSEAQIRALFAEVGQVDSVTLMTSGSLYAFVEMALPHQARAAAERFNGLVIDGMRLIVYTIPPKSRPRHETAAPSQPPPTPMSQPAPTPAVSPPTPKGEPSTMNFNLKGKCALVAAGSKGLGLGIARALAQEGSHIALCGRDLALAQQAATQIKTEFGVEARADACDVAQASQISAWVGAVGQQFGKIDLLVVNAGGPPAAAFTQLNDTDWQAAFDLNLMSAVRLVRATLPLMPNGGAILMVTSSSAKEPIERLALSNVMRAGVAALVKTLADELGARAIRVNNLIPGRIETDRVVHLDQTTAANTGQPYELVRQTAINKIPLRRLGTTDEFGAAAAFLLSDAASYITGASLRIDGGAMRSVGL